MNCKKRKFDKIGAMLAIAEAVANKYNKRMENRFYLCNRCKHYHLTSTPLRKGIINEN